MSDEKREARPIGEVLGDTFEIPSLPEGWTALGGIVLVKCLTKTGRPGWAFRETPDVNDEEVIGALTIQLDILRQEVKALFGYPGDDDGDDDY